MDNNQVDQLSQILSLLQIERLVFLAVSVGVLVALNRLLGRFGDRLGQRLL